MDTEKVYTTSLRLYKNRPVHHQAYRYLKEYNKDIFKTKDDFIAEAIVYFAKYLQQEEDVQQMKKWKDTKYKIQEDKKVENKMIIGIDHGNRNMKTANTVFSAAIQPLQAKPDSLEHILEYQNQFYYVGGKVPEKECVDKTENENYYLLTMAALAQEMRYRGLTDASVKMGAALPPRRFQQQKESFKKYLLKTKELHFRYEGVHYHVSLENVFVFMQGHVVIHTLLEAVPGYCLLVDIGGGTTDLVEFVDGMPDGKYSISDKAALYCIGKVNEEAIAKTGAGVPAYITEAFMRTGSYDCPKQYQEVIINLSLIHI